jgi:hypothetical protein
MTLSLLAVLVAALAVHLLGAISSRQVPRKAKGVRLLTWPAPLRWFVAFMLPASVGMAWMAMQARPSQIVMAALVAGFFLLASIYLVYCVLLYRVWWTTDGIGSWHPLGGSRFLRWDAVEEGRYVESVQAFYVKGGGTRIWYSPMQSGIAHLHRYIGVRVQPQVSA